MPFGREDKWRNGRIYLLSRFVISFKEERISVSYNSDNFSFEKDDALSKERKKFENTRTKKRQKDL